MKILQKINRLLLGTAVFVTSAIVSMATPVASTYAEDTPDYRIQMTPARKDIGDLKPGQKFSDKFFVQNTGTKEFKFTVGVTPYSVVDEQYNPDYDSDSGYTDIVNWIKFSVSESTVQPNSEVEVAYTVTVPADVPAGGQYAMLYAEIAPTDGFAAESGVGVARRVGMLLYSNVEGNTRKTGIIEENKLSSILFNPPITATSIVKNTGNTHATAKYVLQVYPLFGDEEVYTNEEEPMTLTILPETRRYNSVSWEGAPHLGIFRVKQTITMFDQTSTTEKVVFLIPLWFLFIVLILLFCVIFWIITRIRNRNKYN